MNRFLEKAGAKKKPRFHSTILPAGFVPSVEDCSKDEETAKTFRRYMELIFVHVMEPCYFCLTSDINYAVGKLAKYTRCPEVVHMEALLRLLR